MKKLTLPLVLLASAAIPAWCQDLSADVLGAIDQARMNAEQAQMKAAQMKMLSMDMANQALSVVGQMDFSKMKSDLAMLQNAVPPRSNKVFRFATNVSAEYDAGTRLLDDRKYDEAIPRFDAVIAAKGERADGALYWKAYALNRIGRRDEALASLAALRRDYPASHWLNDAQALEAEVKQSNGQPVSPSDQSNEDIKLMAINALMNADPDRAVPLLENLLKSGSSPKLKDRALFVLTQSKSPKAQQILTDYAKGAAGNPDLQLWAVRYIGMAGTAESQQLLGGIYSSSNDAAIKREILRSLMSAGAKDQLFNIARTEKDANLRNEAIRQLGAMRDSDHLMKLYTPDAATDLKIEVIRALSMGPGIPNESLVSLYTADADPKLKKELINGIHSRSDAKPLIAIARKETDPAMKKYIVERLATMRNNKDATDYMMELLK